jgi:hypothetical protein
MSARQLCHYFEAHGVRVLINQTLNDIFNHRDSLGRISKWAMELSKRVIDFEKRSALKSQVLADFIADCTELSIYTEGRVPESPWLVYYDGVWGNVRPRALTILISPSRIKLRYAVRLQFTKETDKCMNNIAE